MKRGDDSSSSNNNYNNSVRSSLERLGEPLPRMVVFDLDYTCWPLWVDTHVDPPLKRRGDAINKVVDRHNQTLSLYPHVPAILFFLQRKGIVVAAASRTCAPNVARQALNNLLIVDDAATDDAAKDSDAMVHVPSVRRSNGDGRQKRKSFIPPVPMMKLFDQLEIYPGSKLTHFRKLHANTGIAYDDMIFFDDEQRNSEVGKLGVHFALVGHAGTDLSTFERAVHQWRAKQKARHGGDVAVEAGL